MQRHYLPVIACVGVLVFFGAGIHTLHVIEIVFDIQQSVPDAVFGGTASVIYLIIFAVLLFLVGVMGLVNFVHKNKQAALFCGFFLLCQCAGLALATLTT